MIKRIRVTNFKSLRDVTVDFGRVTVLIGRSGTGKSNFVDSLKFLRDYLRYTDAAVEKAGDWNYLARAGAREESGMLAYEVDFTFPGSSAEFSYRLAWRIGSGGVTFEGEALTVNGNQVFQQTTGKWAVPPGLVEPPQPGRLALQGLYGIPDARAAYLLLSTSIGCYDFSADVLLNIGVRGDATSMDDHGVNFLSALDGITSNISEYERINDMLGALRRLNSTVTSVDITADRQRVRVGHRVADGRVLSLYLHQESSGFRRFLASLIALYQQPPKQILCFEEPENGIFPGALAVLADHFRQVAASGRSQIILTTHSPQLLKHFAPEEIRVVTMRDYDTHIGPLAPEQRASIEEHLMTADELLTVDEARPAD